MERKGLRVQRLAESLGQGLGNGGASEWSSRGPAELDNRPRKGPILWRSR